MSVAVPSRQVLLVHGAGAWGGQWQIWRRVFEAEGWSVDSPDLQPAAAGLAATRLENYRAQVREWIASAPGALVVGASLGGLLAWAAASDVPFESRPRALVLVNPLPPTPWVEGLAGEPRTISPAASAPSGALDQDDGGIRPWASQGRFASTVRALPAASFPDRLHAFRHWRDESTEVLREAREGIDLPSPSMPVLVMTSEGDHDIPPAIGSAMAAAIRADSHRVAGTHIDPVMGRSAADAARYALAWFVSRDVPALSRRMTPA